MYAMYTILCSKKGKFSTYLALSELVAQDRENRNIKVHQQKDHTLLKLKSDDV